jgi:hypothetical protein
MEQTMWQKTWQAELEIEHLRDIAFRFIGLLSDDNY